MKKIIFVCTGNTCRSPMAEVMAAELWQGKAEVCSRGLGHSGMPMSESSKNALEKYGFKPKKHFSKALTLKELEECDIVLTMTEAHKNIIRSEASEFANKVFTLCEYAGQQGDIPDPFMQPQWVYDECCKKILSCIKAINILE